MISHIFCFRTLFIFLLRSSLIAVAVFYLAFIAHAQTPTSPTTFPTPPVNPTSTPAPLPTPQISAPEPVQINPTQPSQPQQVTPSQTQQQQQNTPSSNQNPNVFTPSIGSGISSEPRADATPDPTAKPQPTIEPETERTKNQINSPENLTNVPNVAPEYRYESRELPELGRVGVDMMKQNTLTLRRALELGLANNKDIELSRQTVRETEFDLQAARGVYQPRLNLQTFYERSTTPTSSIFQGGTDGKVVQSSITGNATYQALEPRYGGNFLAQFNNSRVDSTSLFNNLNPQYATTLNFQYTQPLFRGRRFDQNRRSIEIVKRNLTLNDSQFRQRTIETITNIQRAYWDLAYSLRNLQVQRDAVRDAKAQLDHNQRLVVEGTLAPIDIVASDTQVANYEQNVYDALNTVSQAENTLKNLIAQNRKDEIWNQSLVPTDSVDVEIPIIELPEAITDALANRPEVEQADVARAINEIDTRFYREQTRPRIDLIANFTTQGLAGTFNNTVNPLAGTNTTATPDKINELVRRINSVDPTRPPITEIPPTTINTQTITPNLLGGYFDSLANLGLIRYPTFRAGIQIDLPFKNRTAQAQLGRSLVEGERVATQRQQLEQLVEVDVRNSLQFVRTSQARLRAAAIARSNSEKQYASEQRKLDSGQSTVYLVLERQTNLTLAQGAELRSQTELNKAIADLQRATGNSLRANNIVAVIR